MATSFFASILSLIITVIHIPIALSQQFPSATCNGIFISYNYSSGNIIPPINSSALTRQPYKFQSVLFAQNNGWDELKSWRIRVGFTHGEYLVSASGAVLADGASLPADVGNGTVFVGESSPDLKTAAQTAGDWSQMQARIELVGTQFGVGPPDVPLPSSLSIANDGYLCPAPPTKIGNNELQLCCNKDPNYVPKNSVSSKNLSPLQNGDLTIMYDVTKSYDTNYWAQVTLSNQSPLGRLDNWHLSWDWTRGEFIHSMRGAYPNIVDTSDCIYGRQGQYYKDLDFSNILNCEKRPTITDLPLAKTNDTNVGLVPLCCRDGIILPDRMDPEKSKSAFIMQVYKMPPDLNRTHLYPPQNFRINGTRMNPKYLCGPPVRVDPTLFPDPNGLNSQWTAVASWQVVCNITDSKIEKPRCCVSFSSFFNDSVVPCNTCACGCDDQSRSATCNATSSPLLLPSEALLVPFDNRTILAKDHFETNKWEFPETLPCGDNCGVSINWHLLTDFKEDWSARMTIFNWGENIFADWSAAVEFEKAGPGFERVYSFNGSIINYNDSNNTIALHGLPGMNYLLGKTEPRNPRRNAPVPGTLQSEFRFTKKNIPENINIANRDGFPAKVYFNGEECSIPIMLPVTSSARKIRVMVLGCFALLSLVFLC